MKETRQHKVISHYGIKDYYAFYRSNGGLVDFKTYRGIIDNFNEAIADVIVNNEYTFKLPAYMGTISVVKKKNKVRLNKDGKMRISFPINWKATMDLWNKDAKAKENKTLIRYENKHTNQHSFSFKYSTWHANYINKSYYTMQFNRQKLKQRLRDLIFKEGNLERGSER